MLICRGRTQCPMHCARLGSQFPSGRNELGTACGPYRFASSFPSKDGEPLPAQLDKIQLFILRLIGNYSTMEYNKLDDLFVE